LIQDGHANEITIKGKNNKNEDVNFMNEKYDPDIGKWRNWEFEGITVWDRGIEGRSMCFNCTMSREVKMMSICSTTR